MIRVEECVLVLLAAGRSRRMGDIGSKLDQPFLGRPLGLHVAVALEDMPFRERVAVCGGAHCDYARHGFTTVRNEDPALGLSHSVRLGVARARELGARGRAGARRHAACNRDAYLRAAGSGGRR